MKKMYLQPEWEIEFDLSDIVTLSGGEDGSFDDLENGELD